MWSVVVWWSRGMELCSAPMGHTTTLTTARLTVVQMALFNFESMRTSFVPIAFAAKAL